jgi:hypothetical protein
MGKCLFQDEMENHLISFKEHKQYLPSRNKNKRWHYPDLQENLFPPIRHSFLQYVYDNSMPLHDYANHVRSSQIFGVNLLYTLLIKEPQIVESIIKNKLGAANWSLEEFKFEYSPESNLLGEWKGDERPDEYVTSADVALIFHDDEGKRNIVLVEIKFTEESFGPCNGYLSPGNTDKSNCKNGKVIFEDIQKCYLQRPARGRSGRTYLDKFADLATEFPGYLSTSMCPFIDNHQSLRNHAFIRGLKSDGYENAFFGLLYHDGNSSIQDHWKRYIGMVSAPLKSELFSMKASELVLASDDGNFKQYFKDRYRIG